MSKTKHNPPWKKNKKKADPNFIPFSKVQQSYIKEILARQQKEFNEALDSVYEEMGITEKLLQAPPGKYILRKDFSGLDIFPVVKEVKVKVQKEKEVEVEAGKKTGEKNPNS